MNEDNKGIKHFIKVWSQAGATLVAAVIAMAIGFEWVDWTPQQIALIMGVYAAAMILLRQMFSITDDIPVGGEINVTMKEDGTKLYSLDVNGDPEQIDQLSKVIFKVNPLNT